MFKFSGFTNACNAFICDCVAYKAPTSMKNISIVEGAVDNVSLYAFTQFWTEGLCEDHEEFHMFYIFLLKHFVDTF